jgi:uncharacterized protein
VTNVGLMENDASPFAVQLIALVPPSPPARARDAIGAVLAAPAARRVLAAAPDHLAAGQDHLPAGPDHGEQPPAGFDLIRPRSGDFGDRVAGAFADAYAAAALPMLLVRADVGAVTPDMLADAAWSLVSGEADAAFGPAADGGFWLLGLQRPDRSLVAGLPDQAAGGAGRLLLDRLAAAGLRVALAPRLPAGPDPAGQDTGPVTVTRVP